MASWRDVMDRANQIIRGSIIMPNIVRKAIYIFGLLYMSLSLIACGISGSPVSGKVIDKSSGQPIEGAIVVARWKGDILSPVDSQTVCFHVESTLSDKEGKFHIPFWVGMPKGIVNQERFVKVYKEGYVEVVGQNQEDDIELMETFTGTREERFKYLKYFSVRCGGSGKSMRNLYEIDKAIYEEMKNIAKTQEEEKLVEHYRRSVAHDAVAEDGHRTADEVDKLINEYLRDHLK